MAQRAVDLLTLPHGLNSNPSIQQVVSIYLRELQKFQNCTVPHDTESENEFTDMLQGMVLERSTIPNAIARGVDDWLQEHQQWLVDEEDQDYDGNYDDSDNDNDGATATARLQEMEDALYRFFTARVGLRFLTGTYCVTRFVTSLCVFFSSQIDSSFASIVVPTCRACGVLSLLSTYRRSRAPVLPTTTTNLRLCLCQIIPTLEHHILSSPSRDRSSNQELRDAQSSSSLFGDNAETPSIRSNDGSYDDNDDDDDDDFFLGCIQANCNPVHEVRKVVKVVAKQTRDYYGDCPEIQIVDATTASSSNNFTYVPHHLHYMIGELLKNSCRATIKRHVDTGARGPIPPIRLVIVVCVLLSLIST